jgi:polyhydroxybutyrate depolymerase
MKPCLRLLLVLAMVVALVCPAVVAAAPTTMTWTVDGVERRALVFAPTIRPAGMKVPLLFDFHGHGGNARLAAQIGFQDFWPEALVVYMQGLPTPGVALDPQGLRPGWQFEAGQERDRDLKFVDAVLATLRQRYPIDDARIYAAGFSNGAYFTYLLWAERGRTFAGFAPCAGRLLASMHPTEPRPVVHIAGEQDHLVKIEGQRQTIETVRQIDGALAAGEPCGPGCTLYPSTKNAPVLAKIHPGGHVFPPGAAALIVKFFKAHPKP